MKKHGHKTNCSEDAQMLNLKQDEIIPQKVNDAVMLMYPICNVWYVKIAPRVVA